ncbi:NrfD/PsrC family molybdoenzyme membrane anchor subunit [Ammoniphilus sp. YIM 78166]|uniref:NrfD/PsrC family molybdoenzyme membrane anchor subunit n=1 Tax=Ammoniphilus sp. YIM 78166 TaxID=1644106 RepID=UPI00107042F3|nr:NrfD/PsrC family molybdoenzyme membrane anchor subunit [Ammoniphilus sp. YIM 78166]
MGPIGYVYESGLQNPLWKWEIVVYFFVAGIAVGTYLFAAFGQLWGSRLDRQHSISGYYFAMPMMMISGLMLILDLSVPDKFSKFLHMMWNPREGMLTFKAESVMSLGSWVIMLFSIIATISFAYALIKHRQWEDRVPFARWLVGLHEGRVKGLFLGIGILSAAYIGTYTGILLSTTHWPVWSTSSLIPLLFLISGVSTGLAAMVLSLSKRLEQEQTKGYIHRLEKADTYIMVGEIVILAVFLISLGPWASVLLSGSNAFLLIGGVVVAGLLVPLYLRYRPVLGEKNSLILSSSLILFGGLILRYIMVVGVQ